MLSSQAREHFKSKATWKGYESINGKKRRRVQYLDNVAKLGSEIVNNQDRKIERDCQVVLSDEFTKRRSSQRQLPIEEAVKAVAFGIETRSDRGRNERYQYLYNDVLSAGRWVREGLFELITAYRITKANKRNFINDFSFLERELTNAGTHGVNAVIADSNMLMAMKLQGIEELDDAIVWRSGDEPFRTSGMTVYTMHMVLVCKGRITKGALDVLKNWGLDISDALEVNLIKNDSRCIGNRYLLSYNMSRFCGNEHEWSYC